MQQLRLLINEFRQFAQAPKLACRSLALVCHEFGNQRTTGQQPTGTKGSRRTKRGERKNERVTSVRDCHWQLPPGVGLGGRAKLGLRPRARPLSFRAAATTDGRQSDCQASSSGRPPILQDQQLLCAVLQCSVLSVCARLAANFWPPLVSMGEISERTTREKEEQRTERRTSKGRRSCQDQSHRGAGSCGRASVAPPQKAVAPKHHSSRQRSSTQQAHERGHYERANASSRGAHRGHRLGLLGQRVGPQLGRVGARFGHGARCVRFVPYLEIKLRQRAGGSVRGRGGKDPSKISHVVLGVISGAPFGANTMERKRAESRIGTVANNCGSIGFGLANFPPGFGLRTI